MNAPTLTCSCGELIIKSDGNGFKIRSKILILKDNSTSWAVCKGCNKEIPVPIRADFDNANPPLFIKGYSKKST